MEILEGQLTLTERIEVARDTVKLNFTVTLNDCDTAKMDFSPGQFVSMEFGPKAWRAYSIASHPDESHLTLVVRLVEGGVASESFRAANLGDTYNFKGPFGHFVLSENPEAILNFCATGTGIAPLRAMILEEAKKDQPRPMRLFYGGRDTQDIAYLDEVKTWASDLEIFLGLSRQARALSKDDLLSPGLNWEAQRITKFLQDFNFTDTDEFYLCGSGPMVKSVNQILKDREIAKERVFQERFN